MDQLCHHCNRHLYQPTPPSDEAVREALNILRRGTRSFVPPEELEAALATLEAAIQQKDAALDVIAQRYFDRDDCWTYLLPSGMSFDCGNLTGDDEDGYDTISEDVCRGCFRRHISEPEWVPQKGDYPQALATHDAGDSHV